MTKIVTKYREVKRHNIPLIRNRSQIIDLTGDYSKNPFDRCGKCGGVAITLRDHTGAAVMKACIKCKLAWWKMKVQITKTITKFVPYGENEEDN